MATKHEMQLTGHWLFISRLVWVTLAFLHLWANLATLPAKLSEPIEIQTLIFDDWTTDQTRTAFAELGLTPEGYGSFTLWSNEGLIFFYTILAFFLFLRKGNERMAYLLSVVFLMSLGTGNFERMAQIYSQPGWNTIEVLNNSISSVLLMVIFFVFPDGRYVPQWTRWVTGSFAIFQGWRAFYPEQYDQVAILSLVVFIFIPISMLYRYFRVSDVIQRQQIKWVVFGTAIVSIPLPIYGIVLGVVPELNQPGGTSLIFFFIGTLFWTGFLILFPITLLISILRYRLFDIDVIIRRTLQYSLLTSLLALAYFGSIVLLQSLFSSISNQQSPIIIVISTLGIAALFNPLRTRVQDFIDRRFFRNKYNAEQTLANFAIIARDEVDMEKLTAALLRVVEETVQPEQVSLWIQNAHQKHPGKLRTFHSDPETNP